ncbi:unnamed protein product [Closterium sp. NIES-53]
MYAFADITEGDCYLRVPPDPGTVAAALDASAAAALGASASAAPGAGTSSLSRTAPTESFHTFTLDSVLAHSSTVLLCPAAPSGLLSGLHLPSFSTNLVSGADLQDAWVDQFTHGGQRVTHCTCSQTGRHLATFTRRPGSSPYTLTTAPPLVPASRPVAVSSLVFAAASRSSPASAPCPCRLLAHETLLWHHRLGHPSFPRLRGMASRALVSGLPRSLPPLPPGPAPTCVPCVEGRQRAAPHSSSFPPTEAPLQTRHMDVWGPARVRGQGHERYFLLVVDGYSRYTTVFPLRSKGEVTEVLIDWIRGARRQLSESFGLDLPVLRLHSDRGGEFSSDLLRAFCRLEGIRQTFTLPASPQQNGIAERRIGMVMDVARMSMIHAVAPHFLWPFAVQYAAHQINLQPCVSLPETTPTLWWTGKIGDASAFRVWGSRAFVRDTTADKLSSRAIPCVFLGFPPDAPGCASPRHSSGHQVDPAEPVEVAVASGAARGAETEGAESGGAESGGAETGRAGPGGVEPEGTVSGGTEPARAASGGALGVPSRREPLSPQRLREWCSRRGRVAAGAAGARAAGGAGGATGATEGTGAAGGGAGAGAAGGAAGAGAAGGATGAGAAGGPRGANGATGGTGATGGGASAAGGAAGGAGSAAGTGGPRAEGTGSISAISGGAARPRPYYVPLLQQSRSASPVRPVRAGRISCLRLPPVLGTHSMTLRPSIAPQRVPLPSPLASSLPDGPDPESDSLCAACPTVTCFLATAVTDPLFESSAASALVAELVDFAAACRLDYAASLVVESASASVCPPSVGGECTLGIDVLEDRQEDLECFAAASPHLVSMLLAPEGDPDALDIPTPRSYAEAIEGPYSSQWQAAMDAEMASWKSTGTYVLQRFGFTYSSPQSTPLPTGHSLSAPPSDESVEPSGPYPELVGCLMYLMTCTRPDLAYPLSLLARYVAPVHRAWGLCLEDGLELSSLVTLTLPGSSCEAEIYAGAMAAQELRWLTYLLTDLGEAPRSPPVLYVDNKAMLALCQEHRMEHRTKHIALRYFLARELQQRGQLRLDYVASQANTADVFTKALQPCDHRRFCTVLACFVFLDWSCDPLFSPTLPMGTASKMVYPSTSRYR